METKGEHLAGNDDPEYKRAVLALLTESFDHDRTVPSGTLELVDEATQATVACDLILMSEWREKLPQHLDPTRV